MKKKRSFVQEVRLIPFLNCIAKKKVMTAQAKLVLCVSLTIPWAVFKILYLYFFKSSETLEEFSYAFSDFAWSLFMVFCVGLVANIVTFSS